ncbi:MAG: DUF2255 family protein [Terracoccus sp.]
MTLWTPTDLATIGFDEELSIAATGPDGTECTPQIIWHVVVDNALYIRSVRGTGGAWYRSVRRTGAGTIYVGGIHFKVIFHADNTKDDAVDDAYRDKYGSGSSVRTITTPEARASTLRVDPA